MRYSIKKPMLHPATNWYKRGDGDYYLENSFYNTNLLVSEYVINFLRLSNGSNTLSEICEKLNMNKTENNIKQIFHLLYETLYPKGILVEEDIKIFKKSSYVKFKITLITKKNVEYITKLTKVLFVKKISYYVLTIVFFIFLLFFYTQNVFLFKYSTIIQEVNLYFCILLLLLTALLHELGHSSALTFYGEKPKSIGFGFYLLSPVFFADVTNAWKLNHRERMKVDLGGVYFQLIFTSLLICLFISSGNSNFLFVSIISLISILFNLNPFIKTDGYWLLSDFFHMYNLKLSSREKLKEIILSIKRKSSPSLNVSGLFLAGYGLLSILFVFSFIYYMVFWNYEMFFLLPNNVLNLCKTLLNKGAYSINIFDIERIVLPIVTIMIITSEVKKEIKRIKNYRQHKLKRH